MKPTYEVALSKIEHKLRSRARYFARNYLWKDTPDDVLQEFRIRAWQAYNEWDPSTSTVPLDVWMLICARYKAFNLIQHDRRKRRTAKLVSFQPWHGGHSVEPNDVLRRKAVAQAMSEMEPRFLTLAKLRFGAADMGQKEIGLQLGVKKQRVHAMELQLIDRLQKKLTHYT